MPVKPYEAKLDWKAGGTRVKYIVVYAASHAEAYEMARWWCNDDGWVCAGVVEVPNARV